MNNIEVKRSDIFLNGNKVFLIIDSTIIQNIAEANIGRELTEKELDHLNNDIIPSNPTFELDGYLLECINLAVEAKSKRKNKGSKPTFSLPIPTKIEF
jgi:hypothetical protein